MAGKVIAVDLDEAAHALKLLAEYLPGGGGLTCRVGAVHGTSEGVTSDFYWRLGTLEGNLYKLATAISDSVQQQHVAIAETVTALVKADGSLSEGAAKLLAQIALMATPTAIAVATEKEKTRTISTAKDTAGTGATASNATAEFASQPKGAGIS